jgi:hypothetical protein
MDPEEKKDIAPIKSGWEKYDFPLDANRGILEQLEEIAIMTEDDNLIKLLERDFYSNQRIMIDQLLPSGDDEDEIEDQ